MALFGRLIGRGKTAAPAEDFGQVLLKAAFELATLIDKYLHDAGFKPKNPPPPYWPELLNIAMVPFMIGLDSYLPPDAAARIRQTMVSRHADHIDKLGGVSTQTGESYNRRDLEKLVTHRIQELRQAWAGVIKNEDAVEEFDRSLSRSLLGETTLGAGLVVHFWLTRSVQNVKELIEGYAERRE